MQALFEKYIKGNCTEEEYKKVVQFIKDQGSDPDIEKLLLTTWKQSANSTLGIKPDPLLLNSIHHKIALKEQSQSHVVRLYRGLLSAAAILILGLVIGTVFYVQRYAPGITTKNISTPYGGKTQFVLPDGSLVWLNSGSTFTYPDRFDGERIVELNGEAYFEVKKQKEPFKVRTEYGEVEVLGTEFNVKAYPDETFCTTLEQGSVVFTNNQGKKAKLEPRMQVVLDSENFELRWVDTELFTSWRDGKLIFKDEPLQKIAIQLERWYNVKIDLKDEQIKQLRFSGNIEMESFSEVLELIKVTTPIEYSFDRDTRVLTIAAQ